MKYQILLAIIAISLPSLVLCKIAQCPNMDQVEKCQRNAEDDWEVDRNQVTSPDKPWCCHQWQAYSCQMDLMYQCKNKTWETNKFNISMAAVHKDLDKRCNEWPEDQCTGLKWWAITLIVIGSLLAVALIGFLVFTLIIKRRSSRRYSAPKG